MMITQPEERMVWLGQHFWDRFTAVDSLYYCDSVTVNGVPLEKLEQQMGAFASLLQEMPLPQGEKAMEQFYGRLEAFQLARPSGNVLPQTVALATRYFYDPNSPLRSEDLYLPFVTRLSAKAVPANPAAAAAAIAKCVIVFIAAYYTTNGRVRVEKSAARYRPSRERPPRPSRPR